MKNVQIDLNEDLVDKIKELSDVVIMWGGGKDSTAALLLASQYAKRGLFKKLIIVTFDNFLTTKSILRNRKTIIDYLEREGVDFEWVVDDFGGEERVRPLYRQALLRTRNARAICVLCNTMSEVLENRILNERRAKYRISGNPSDELKTFEHWEGALGFKRVSKNPRYNTLYGWSKLYDEWLNSFAEDSNVDKRVLERFRLPKPKVSDYSVKVENLSLFDFHREFLDPKYRLEFVEKFGWKLPPTSEGVIGTETDCMLPSIMYGLHILRKEDYVAKLRQLEGENMMPLNILYRGIDDQKTSLRKTREFLGNLGVSEQEWINSKQAKMPESLEKYLGKCLLPVR